MSSKMQLFSICFALASFAFLFVYTYYRDARKLQENENVEQVKRGIFCSFE